MKCRKAPLLRRLLPPFLCFAILGALAACENEAVKTPELRSEAVSSEIQSKPSAVSQELSSAVKESVKTEEGSYPFLKELLTSVESPNHLELYRSGGRSVRITSDLLRDIYGAIAAAELTEIESEGITSYYEPDLIDLYYYKTYAGYPDHDIQVYPPNKERAMYHDKTLLFFPQDASTISCFMAPPALYYSIRSLVDAQTVPSEVSFDGNYVKLKVPPDESGEWRGCFFDQDGRIVFLQGWHNVPVLDAATGKLLFTLSSPAQILRTEPYNGGIRLLSDAYVAEYDMDGQELSRFDLPEDIRSGIQEVNWLNRVYQYDIADNKIVYPAPDGVYLWENGISRQLLDNGELPTIVSQELQYVQESEADCRYSDPQLLANGTRLCAAVYLEQSQNGYVGLLFLDLLTGEKTYLWNLFGINVNGMNIPDDKTVQTFAEAGMTEINATTLQRTLVDTNQFESLSSFYRPRDGAKWFEEYRHRDKNGIRCLDIRYPARESAVQTLCTIRGEHVYRAAVTDHYLIYCDEDSVKSGIIAIPY
ncbi:hypothetical protein [Anaeromassilibacillus senegalensis]|uniref:hypothetical protein n=1 Tax=Anaeromassilibacillus senegalensis TaxID=1673717 RepID=UPI0006808557|nr:hypothetical protein [Anaeromassilibacillus senegalensis]